MRLFFYESEKFFKVVFFSKWNFISCWNHRSFFIIRLKDKLQKYTKKAASKKICICQIPDDPNLDHDLYGRDHASYMVKHNIETSDTDVNSANFKTININFSNNKKKRKFAESLSIKDLRPTLNIQEKSVPLKLFN